VLALKRPLKRLAVIALVLWPIGAEAANYNDALQYIQAAKYGLAMKEFKQLAEEGHAPSQFSLGLMYHLGRGVDKDQAVAYEYYKQSALKEHPPALNNIGMMYLNGDYVAQNRDVAFRLFQKASTTHAQAMDNLGQCFENGWGVDRNIRRAREMYQLSGENGYIKGWYHLGQLFEKGYPDTPKNDDTAVEWYIKAAEKKHKKSINRLNRLGRLPAELAQ